MASEQNPPDDMSVDVADNSQQSQEPHSPLKGGSPMRMSSFDALLAELKERPHNPDGWRQLVEMSEQSGEAEKIRTTFDILLKQYPNTASAQIAYINFFLNDQSTFSEAEELFKKFLRSSPSVDLWKFYLTYVRRLNAGPGPLTRDTVRKSYEFALNHVGQDKDSGEIWSDFIQFLKSADAGTTWEEQQKMDALRKVYHRAVQIPLDNVERLWQELETFETNLNKITAKKFMADLSPAHMQARTVLRQLTNHLSGLFPSTSPAKTINGRQEIWLPTLPKFDQAERTLVGKWKAYLKWEESNPLEIEDKDKSSLITRLQGVYRKAVIRMRYYSEIWYMAYIWTSNVGKTDEALAILKAGIEANPTSYLLNFAYIEAQEVRKEVTEVHAAYDRFLSALRIELETMEKAIPASVNSNGTANPSAANGGAADTTLGDTALPSSSTSQQSHFSQDDNRDSKELAEKRSEYGVAWVMYMRFGRRAEGVKSSRAIFGKARKDRWTSWEVYEAAALMEYHCSNEKSVSSRIFEKGLDLFSGEVDFVLRYLGFLISINDENNARALFERMIGTFPPERARPLWDRWARYEYQYGDLEAAQKLEKRIAEVYPNDPPIKRFAQRHIYLTIDAIAQRDLGFAVARKESSSTSSMSLSRTETQTSLSFPTLHQTGSISLPSSKRTSSIDRTRRDDSRGMPRPRSRSPPPHRDRELRDRDRDRDGRDRETRDRDRDRGWEGPGRGGRRFSPPPPSGWERDGSGGGGGGGGGGRDRSHRGGGRDDGEKGKHVAAYLLYARILFYFYIMTTNESEKAAHEIVDDNRKNDDGDVEEVSAPPESGKGKGKEKSTSSKEDDSLANEDDASDSASGSGSAVTGGNEVDASASQEPQPWQAVFAPQYNAYYFYNSQTGETTWTNPLQPSSDSAPPSSAAVAPNSLPSSTEQGAYSDVDTSENSSSSTSTATPYTALQAAALAQGIDPSLAHLDPALVTATTSASGGPIPMFQAKFNARTGAFTRPDARTPGHLSEYERMKRMSQFYFDVNAWEQQVADDKEEEEVNGKKRKRPTKKDLERFKEQKKQKKIAKTAWLRT